MRRFRCLVLVTMLAACASCSRSTTKYPSAGNETLRLSRVFLYRNGIGYFERQGRVTGDTLRIKVRKDQVNDLLKSLTVVHRDGGQAVSISMPLDPQTWANAALATLAPGHGNLAQVLDALRGTAVTLVGADRTIRGRIVMVEDISEPSEVPESAASHGRPGPVAPGALDHRVTLMDGSKMSVMRLSRLQAITLEDGDLALQFHRSLDASAGEGMFQQVDVAIRLTGANSHDLAVSYVVPAPMWKPTYRVVLPENGKGKALLQGWAVVDNVSGEDWRDVKLGLTSGAPIAFRYDLHTPREVDRPDLTETGVRKRAAVAVGESTFAEEAQAQAEAGAPSPSPSPPPPAEAMPAGAAAALRQPASKDKKPEGRRVAPGASKKSGMKLSEKAAREIAANDEDSKERARPEPSARADAPSAPKPATVAPPPPPAVDFDSLRRSTLAQARAAAVSGLTRFDLAPLVTVPDGASTMVAVVNQEVEGEETFLFKPGGAGVGYETNPYRVVRFKNGTPFALESGPIAIYAGGSFVGEGISEAVGAGASVTIPFAVESGITLSSLVNHEGEETHLLRMVRGVLDVERFSRRATTWTAKTQTSRGPITILVRHSKAGPEYEIVNRAKRIEDLPDAYLVPIDIPKGQTSASTTITEQTPSTYSMSIWEGRALPLLEKLLLVANLSPDNRQRLAPIVARRQEIGSIDSKIEELKAQQAELDQRARETRQNLEAIMMDRAAGALRAKLNKRLEQFAADGDRLGREVVELQTKRMGIRVELEDSLQNLDLTVARPAKK